MDRLGVREWNSSLYWLFNNFVAVVFGWHHLNIGFFCRFLNRMYFWVASAELQRPLPTILRSCAKPGELVLISRRE